MVLIGILNDLKNALNKSNIDKQQFVAQLLGAMVRATKLWSYVDNVETFDDLVTLIAYNLADGDTNLMMLISHLIFTYIDIVKDLDGENRTHIKELIAYYLQK